MTGYFKNKTASNFEADPKLLAILKTKSQVILKPIFNIYNHDAVQQCLQLS